VLNSGSFGKRAYDEAGEWEIDADTVERMWIALRFMDLAEPGDFLR
jgi:hypothetical protein